MSKEKDAKKRDSKDKEPKGIIKSIREQWIKTIILLIPVIFGILFYSIFVDVRITPLESEVYVKYRSSKFPIKIELLSCNTSIKVIVANESPLSLSSVFTYYTIKIKSDWQPDNVEIYYQFGEEPKIQLLESHEDDHIYLGHIPVGKEKEIDLLFINADGNAGTTTTFTIEAYLKLRNYQRMLTEKQGIVHWCHTIGIVEPGPVPSP
ncbi:hypothetical protein KQH65_02830 [archaeon]|nr:hypothetical protein [archaeon]